MPPKRPRRHSSNTGLPAGQRLKRSRLAGSHQVDLAWGWVGTEVADSSEIAQIHRLATCGFSRNSGFPLCINKYADSTPQSRAPLVGEAQEILNQGELEDDTIVISDDEVHPCSPKRCRNNPYCLNHLGQDKWEGKDMSRKAFYKAAGVGEDPRHDARSSSAPVGLKNLGATCYANAFLQVWFQDIPFRNGVYQCLPSCDSELRPKFEDSPIFHLQVTFAAMQESTRNAFNPVKLVESLKLRTTEQQDAQEFSKLFMAHLDSEFQKQSMSSLKTLVADQFQGTQVYGTHCTNCNNRSERESEFLEVEVNIPRNDVKLEDRLAALLQSESLSGDNQYFCSVCNELQDAKRYTEFKRLPPVLHISLLRFVFDLQTLERKKSKHTISFPPTLDMASFLQVPGADEREGNQSRPENTYHLRGVLVHKGPSAYHGHYEAQVYDVQTQSWYQFNDEVVTKMDATITGPRPKTNTTRTKQKKAIRIDDSDVEVVEMPSPTLGGGTDALNSGSGRISSKDAYMLIYSRATLEPASASMGEQAKQPISVSLAHMPMPPRALEVIRALNTDFSRTCDEFTTKVAEVDCHFEEKRRTMMALYRSWSLSSYDEEAVVVSRQALETWLARHISASIKVPECSGDPAHPQMLAYRESDNIHVISNVDVSCPHGKLNPSKAADMKLMRKVISQRILADDGCCFEPQFCPDDVCPRCTEEEFGERNYQFRHPQIVSRFDEVSRVGEEEEGFWISKHWLKDWRLGKPKMHQPSKPDPPPDASEYKHHVSCEHGALSVHEAHRRLISTAGYNMLKEIFLQWTTLPSSAEVCAVCDAFAYISNEDKREIRKKAEDEKARLKYLYETTNSISSASMESEACVIVPLNFLRSWKQWLCRPTEIPRPEYVDNTSFICLHGGLNFDPNEPDDSSIEVAIIRRCDYNTLTSLYNCGPLIEVVNNGDKLAHTLPVCVGCRIQRKSAFEEAEVIIRVLRPGDPIPTSESSSKEITSLGAGYSHPSPIITYGSRKINGIRQSKRIRQVKTQGRRRRVSIVRGTTVKQLKLQLQEDIGIPAIYQRLFHQGRNLEDSVATLVSLGIVAGDTLDVQEEPEDVDLLASEVEEDRSLLSKEGRAFDGTLLSGNQERAKHLSPEPQQSPTPPETCSACTFVNLPNASICAICDTVLGTFR